MTRIPSRSLAAKPAPGKSRRSDLSVDGKASVELVSGASSGAGSAAANAGRTRRDGGGETCTRIPPAAEGMRAHQALAGRPFSEQAGAAIWPPPTWRNPNPAPRGR